MNAIDTKILDGLVRGDSAEEIALSLDIPLDWVTEFVCHPVERVVDDRLSGQTIDR
jgi:hypothetical protein